MYIFCFTIELDRGIFMKYNRELVQPRFVKRSYRHSINITCKIVMIVFLLTFFVVDTWLTFKKGNYMLTFLTKFAKLQSGINEWGHCS